MGPHQLHHATQVKHATVLGPCQTIAGMFGDCSGPLPSSHHPLDQASLHKLMGMLFLLVLAWMNSSI